MSCRTNSNTTLQNLLLIGLAVVFPPVPVFLLDNYRVLTRPMLITVLLTLCGHVPGVIFAIYYVLDHESFKRRLGYSRLDDEQAVPNETTTAHNHVDHPPLAPVGHYTDEVSHINGGDEPPSYQDIGEGSSHGGDAKAHGDNKVQQE